jgi:hypothetical protein
MTMKTNIEYNRNVEGVTLSVCIQGAATIQEAFAALREATSLPGKPSGPRLNPNQPKCTLDQFLDWLRGCGPLKKHEIKFRSMERFGYRQSKFYNVWGEAMNAGRVEQVGGRWQVAA